MLDIQLLRTNLENIARLLATRGYSFPASEFETLEAGRKSLQTHTQELQARRNAVSRPKPSSFISWVGAFRN